jgi:hypothetical protein
LPSGTQLGILELLRVYIEYDGPRLFSCRNQAGQLFLVAWVDDDDNGDRWHYLPLSRDRLAEVESGESDLRQAFLRPESGLLYAVTVGARGVAVRGVKPEAVESDLPAAGLRLAPLRMSP